MNFTVYIIPILIGIIFICAFIKKVDVFNEFMDGAKENLQTGVEILPALIALMLAIGMFRASGALDYIVNASSPLLNKIGFPAECVALALIRPISGSGALAVYENILSEVGTDNFAERVASVMLGSTETTFYTIAVYYGATKIKKTRHTLPCALAGDLTGFIFSALLVRLMLS